MPTLPPELKDSLAHLPDAILLVDAHEDCILACNERCCRLIGESEAQLLGSRLSRLFQEQRGPLIGLTQEVMASGEAWRTDLALTLRDNTRIEVEISAATYPGNTRPRLLLVLRDRRQLQLQRDKHEVHRYHQKGLMEWRRAQQLFRDTEHENRLILHAVGEGIYGVNVEGRTTFVNPAAERMLGWKAEELMGRVIHRVVHHSHEDGSIFPLKDCPIYGAFRDGTIKRVGQDWFWRRDGSGFPVEYTSTPIIDQGEPTGAVVVFKDISQRLISEKALREALEEVDNLRRRLELENAYLQEELSAEHHFHEILGKSEAIKGLVRKIGLVAPTDANVLISGESGTGKELIARAIHKASDRRDRPLIRVNCAAIPKDLFESEFFGHVKGAYTGATSHRIGRFELADGGTLFLDEVGEIPLELQGKLLRVLQEQQFERVGDNQTRTVNVRVIAATNRDLREEAREKRFREDLYFRLNVFPIESIPLRQRKEDIPMLAQAFINHACQRFHRPPITLRISDVEKLTAYHWPGNVRELEHVIERQVITSEKRLNLELHNTEPARDTTAKTAPLHNIARSDDEILTEQALHQLEKSNLIKALQRTQGRIFGPEGAAALLGIKPTTLNSRLAKWQIDRQQTRQEPD